VEPEEGEGPQDHRTGRRRRWYGLNPDLKALTAVSGHLGWFSYPQSGCALASLVCRSM
jgi:hypothetical protein